MVDTILDVKWGNKFVILKKKNLKLLWFKKKALFIGTK